MNFHVRITAPGGRDVGTGIIMVEENKIVLIPDTNIKSTDKGTLVSLSGTEHAVNFFGRLKGSSGKPLEVTLSRRKER